jgi:hypothetical protein
MVLMKQQDSERIGRLWFEDMWNIPDFNITDKIVSPNYKPEWIYIDATGPELV